MVVILGGLTNLMAPYANGYVWIAMLFLFSGVSFGAIRILSTTLVAKNATPNNRGVANGLLDVSQSGGHIAKIFTSPFVETLGFVPVFIFGGVMGLIAAIPIIFKRFERS